MQLPNVKVLTFSS